jgi:hypothetical protein
VTAVGALDDLGHWLVRGHELGALPENAAVLAWRDAGGKRITLGYGPQLHARGTDGSLRWIGSSAWAGKIMIGYIYKVLWPAPNTLVGPGRPVVAVGRASCAHPPSNPTAPLSVEEQEAATRVGPRRAGEPMWQYRTRLRDELAVRR